MDTTTLILYVVGGFLLLRYGKGLFRSATKLALPLILVGAVIYFVTGGSFNVASQTVAGQAEVVNAYWVSGAVNQSTSDDYLSSNDKVISIYVDDADAVDGEYINLTFTAERASTDADAAAYNVECTTDGTFSSGGTNYNIWELDADQNIYATIDGSGTNTPNGVNKLVSFSSTSIEDTVVVRFGMDETGEDAATAKNQYDIYCTIGGQTLTAVVIVND